MNENLSQETLADASHVVAADGGRTVESPALTLDELNKTLGANFKDPSTALQALKDTKDFVGKRKEDIANEVRASVVQQNASDSSLKSDVQALKDQLFYSQNPQYKDMQPIIQKLGTNPADVVNSEEFKPFYEKVAQADAVVQTKSVVSSNNRLSQPDEAVIEHAVRVANARGTTNSDVAEVLARAINFQNQEQR